MFKGKRSDAALERLLDAECDRRVAAEEQVKVLTERTEALETALREVLEHFTYVRGPQRSFYALLDNVEGRDYRHWAGIAGTKE